MDNLPQGCFQISRGIFDSDIFTKPSDWFKVWVYIIGKVNFKDNGLPRGSGYFKYEWIERDCGVSYNKVTKICKYLKEKNQIDVKKATHGCVITVVNYLLYQSIDNYKGKTEARQRQDRGKTEGDNIKKNERMKEGKNEKEDVLSLIKYKDMEGVKKRVYDFYGEDVVSSNISKFRLFVLFVKNGYDKVIDSKEGCEEFFTKMIDKSSRYGYSGPGYADRDRLLVKAKEMYDWAEGGREIKNHMSTFNKFLAPTTQK